MFCAMFRQFRVALAAPLGRLKGLGRLKRLAGAGAQETGATLGGSSHSRNLAFRDAKLV